MPVTPVTDVRGSGTLRIKSAPAVGPGDSFRSSTAVNAAGVLVVNGNQSTDVERTMGDGRKWTPVQAGVPASLTPGEYFVETYGGLQWWTFVDSAGNPQRIRPGPQPTTTSIPAGPAVVLVTLNVDTYRYATYSYCAQNPVTGASVSGVYALGNDGTTGADAVTVQGNDVVTVTIGSVAVTFSVALTGAGVSQAMTWSATAGAANWQITFTQVLAA